MHKLFPAKEFLWILLPVFVGLIASLPLFGTGFIPTHDGEYHIIRFWQFAVMLKEGILFPRWAPDLNSGYGVPLFTFHYPFANYVAFLFHLTGTGFVDAFKLNLAAGYFTALIGCFAWLSRVFSRALAAVGTALCLMVPYWFVDMYVRGSIGEVWAVAWFFVLLWAVESSGFVLAAAASAFLILSHNILAMFFIPVAALYMARANRAFLWTIVVGMLLSCYFWLPALWESQFVTGLNSVAYADHFPMLVQLIIPSWGTGFSVNELTADEMSYQIGIVPLLVLLLGFLRKPDGKPRILFYFFVGVFATAVFLMLELSKPVWEMVPLLPLVQYPWRFLIFVLPVVAFMGAGVASRYPRWVTVLLILLSFTLSYRYMQPVIYARRDDAYYLSRREFTDGTSSLGNTFSSRWTDWKKNRSEQKIEVREGRADVSGVSLRPLSYRFDVTSAEGAMIAVHTMFYPGWTLTIDGAEDQFHYEKEGILEFPVTAGTHQIHIYFRETGMRKIADSVSLLSLLWLVVWAILRNNRKKNSTGIHYAHRYKHGTPVRRT